MLAVAEIIEPLAFALRSVFEREEIANEVVVAEVPVAEEKVKVERVEDAGARKPFRNARVVEVACSFVASLVNGHANEEPPEAARVPLVNERLAPIVNGTMEPSGEAYGIWDEREVIAKLVVVP